MIRTMIARMIASQLGFRDGDVTCKSVDVGIHCLKPARHVEETGSQAHAALGGRQWLGGIDSEPSRRIS